MKINVPLFVFLRLKNYWTVSNKSYINKFFNFSATKGCYKVAHISEISTVESDMGVTSPTNVVNNTSCI